MTRGLTTIEKLCLIVAAIGLGLVIPPPYQVAQSAEAATVLMHARLAAAIACVLSGAILVYLRSQHNTRNHDIAN